jgi:hypothetical protein
MWNKIKSLFAPTPEVEGEPIYLVVWGVVDGPYTLYEEDDEDDEDAETPYYNICKVNVTNDPEVFHTEIYFDSFSEAYDMKRHFDKSIEPIYLYIGEA